MRLTDKVAIVTGAGRGIGCAIAKIFSGEGARVGLLQPRDDRPLPAGNKPPVNKDFIETLFHCRNYTVRFLKKVRTALYIPSSSSPYFSLRIACEPCSTNSSSMPILFTATSCS